MLTADVLVEKHTRLAYWTANRYRRRALALGADPADVEQEALVGLIRAAQRHDPQLGDFTSYAAWHIRAAIQTHLRRWRPMSSLPAGEDGAELPIADCRNPDQDALADFGTRQEVERLLATLHPRLRALVQARFGLLDGRPRTQAELAKEFGVSVSRIGQLMKLALRHLRGAAERRRLGAHVPA